MANLSFDRNESRPKMLTESRSAASDFFVAIARAKSATRVKRKMDRKFFQKGTDLLRLTVFTIFDSRLCLVQWLGLYFKSLDHLV